MAEISLKIDENYQKKRLSKRFYKSYYRGRL